MTSPVGCGRNRLTARSVSGGTRIATGSLIASAPGGNITERCPEKVTRAGARLQLGAEKFDPDAGGADQHGPAPEAGARSAGRRRIARRPRRPESLTGPPQRRGISARPRSAPEAGGAHTSSEATVRTSNGAGQRTKACPGRTCSTSTFKGAGPGWPPILEAHRDRSADRRRQHSARSWLASPGAAARAGRRPPSFAPSGHVGPDRCPWPNVLGFLFVVGAGFNGANFLDFAGQNINSLIVALLALAALCCYLLGLYLLPAPSPTAPD